MSRVFEQIYHDVKNGHAAVFEKQLVLEEGIDPVTVRRRFLPPQRLIILGGGHVGKALCELAVLTDFEVVVVDDRLSFANTIRFSGAHEVICEDFTKALRQLNISSFDYVAVLTRGHRNDAECMHFLLKGTEPCYLGMIGSHRRVNGLFTLMREEGYSEERIARVYSPIGLDIGAVTPQEIAVSILAELIAHRRRDIAAGEKNDMLVQENSDMELLQYMASPGERAAYVLVVDTKGSTPVKSGAVMAVNESGIIRGTVGGGCGEHALMREALEVLKTGCPRMTEADMTNDVASQEGMVCGGRMRVYIDLIV